MSQEETIAELKKLLDTDKIILGTSRTMKAVKQGKVEKVFMCANPAKEVKEDLEYYSGLSGFALEHLDIPNDELGTVCRKSFSISIISVMK